MRTHGHGRLERPGGRHRYADVVVVTTLVQVDKASGKKGCSSQWYA